MSKTRHATAHYGALVRTFGVNFLSPQRVVYPVTGWDQLVYSAQGVLTVHTAAGAWVLPAQRALWVPNGIEHSIQIGSMAALRCLYFRAGQVRQLPRACCAVNVSPLLRELILTCIELGALLSQTPAHRRLAAVLLDQLRTLPTVPLQLPEPTDLRAHGLAQRLRKSPSLSLLQAATACGTSLRTLERLFLQETQMPLGAWFRRLRLQLALEQLAAGATVNQAAHACGYNGASAFVSMFRRELGVTPWHYFSPALSTGKRASTGKKASR